MRLRRPYEEKQDNILLLPGFTDNDPVGWFGLYTTDFATFRLDDIEKFKFILVEGENDAISCRESFMEHGIAGVFFFAACGNHNSNTDMLVQAGIKKLYVLGDEPSPDFGKGDEWVRQRLETACEIDARVFVRWGELQGTQKQIKDPDDALQTHGFEHFYKLVVEEAATSYVAIDIWALDKAVAEASQIDEGETRARQKVAVDYGSCVKHPALLASYIEKVCAALHLAAGPLRSEIVQNGHSEAAFIGRIAETLKHEFHICYKVDNGRGGTLYLYHRQSRTPIEFFMTDGNAMLSTLSNIFGDMYDYFKNSIGLPPTYGDDDAEELPHTAQIRERQKDLGEYLKIAMQTVYKDVPAKTECIEIRQGIHLLPDLERNGEKLLFLLNGKRIFLGRWNKPGIPHLSWEELHGPTYGRYLFTFQEDVWSKEIHGIEDLEWGNAVTLEQIRDAVKDANLLFENCWRFTHHKLDAKFLANHLFASAIHTAFPSKVIVGFLGPSHSGKSTVMSVFDGGQYKHLQLQEAAWSQSSYTAASVYMTWNHSSMSMGLQEFETGEINTQKGQAVENISEMLRQVIFDEGATISRGTAEGRTKSFHLHTNVYLTAITKARHPQDENRRFTVEMAQVDGLKDPTTAIFDYVTPDRYLELRRITTLGLLKHALELSKHHDAVYAEMNRTPITSFSIPTRFLRNFIPMASVMTLLGEEWKPFVVELCASRKDSLAAIAKDNAASNIFARITHTPTIQIGQHGRASLTSMLGREDLCKMINTSNSGVFYDDEKKLIIIDWVATTSPGGLLHRVDDIKGSYRNLKYCLDQHPNAVKSRDYLNYGVFEFLRTANMVADENEISVIRIHELVKAVRANGPQVSSQIASLAQEASNTNVGNV